MKRLYLLMLSALFVLTAAAQDGGAKDINVDINTDGGGAGFWANPVVWIVGAAVFILLLVALLRGGRKD
jgi:hypothetical protein